MKGEALVQWTVEMVLNRALLMENQSYNLYVWARDAVSNSDAKMFLNELAKEELEHKGKLSDALKNRKKIVDLGSDTKKIEDLKIIDWLRDTTLSESVTYQEILIFVGKREKATYEHYLNLSDISGQNEIGHLFYRLAQEELKHKIRIEKEYDANILKEM